MSGERQLLYWVMALALSVAALVALGAVLLPFVLGMAIAYFLDPVADRLEGWGLGRTLAATAMTVVFLIAVVAFLVLLAPLLQAQLLDLATRIPAYADMVRERAESVLALVQARLTPEDLERLRDAAGGLAGNFVAWLGKLLSGIWSGGLALVNLVSLIVITPIVTFYMLRDWDRLVARLDGWLPRGHAATIRTLLGEIDAMLAAFARGQALVCLMLGAFYGIGLSLIGLDFGLVVGLATGLMSFVPFFGMLIGLVVAFGLALAQFDAWTPIVLVAIVFVVGQVVEGNFVTPKLVGDRVGLHPVWMIFALLAGGAWFGFLGVLLAVPVAATVGVLARFGLGRYLAGPLYGGGDGDGGGAGGP